jgi:DNA-binding MarR family transcriptional regulator
MPPVLQATLGHIPAVEMLALAERLGGTLEMQSGETRVRLVIRDGRVRSIESKDNDAGQAILDLLGWTSGTCALWEETEPAKGAKDIDLELRPLIEEAARRAEEALRIAQLYPDADLVLRVVDDPSVQGQISLGPEEFRVLFRIGGGRSVEQLCSDLGYRPAELFPLLRKLETNGLITRGQSSTQPAASSLVGSLTQDSGAVFPLLEDEYLIGRDASNPISIADNSISLRHARIIRGPDGFFIEDLQSRNGTFVNGGKVTDRRLLANNDLVRIGKVILTFNLAIDAVVGDETAGVRA